MKLLVNEWDQSLEGALVAPTPIEQQPGDPRVGIGNAAILGQLSLRFRLWRSNATFYG
jgi:hypothetical protein